MFGDRMVRAFEAVKDAFDPKGLLNPGKIVRAPKMDDRTLFRYKPGYHGLEVRTALDPWDEPADGPRAELMRRVKARFDPAGTCNRGRFAAEI